LSVNFTDSLRTPSENPPGSRVAYRSRPCM